MRFRPIAALLAVAIMPAFTAYVPSMRDTGPPEPPVEYSLTIVPSDPGEYVMLGEVGNLQYYFRDDRDIIAVVDKRNGYTWKTGLDVPFNLDVDSAVLAAATPEERLAAAAPKEDRLNATFTGMANSLLSAEFYDSANNIGLVSSASHTGARSELYSVDGSAGRYVLDIHFPDYDLGVKLHIHLTGEGLRYHILDDELAGEGVNSLAALLISPFLGASGGSQTFYDPETGDYGAPVRKPMIPGYILVPDGPGALIRFRQNSVVFDKYVGAVYGVNYAETTYHTSAQFETVPYKTPLMPVFGIAHGDRQAAFAFWADSGAEHLELIVSPESHQTNYYYAYPRFVYNRTIWQVYNRRGDGYTRLYPERNHFDVDVTYRFLSGDGSDDGLPADYTGMALAYRAHLIETGLLTQSGMAAQMPIHLDFVMSDLKRDIVGYRNMVVTTADGAGAILRDLIGAGIGNINAGLLGAQRGGITGGKPWKLDFTRSIGSGSDFRALISDMAGLGADVYFTQDYSSINGIQMRTGPNMAFHRNNWGVRRIIESENTGVPITEISFARPEKSARWLSSQASDMRKTGAVSIGVDGISSRLISHHGTRPTNAGEAIALIAAAFDSLGMSISAYTPNHYLWGAVDRFINAPLLPTQYIIQTDTVPFLQMVLNGSMEVYGPYANFSFYTRSDVLRMIDYNVFPSFVLTEKPAYLLAETNSAGFYSTSYDLYRDVIISVYSEMNAVYGQIAGQVWIGRDVMQSGVIINRYDGGAIVIINYTESPFTYEGQTIAPLSAVVQMRQAPGGGGR